MASNIQAHITSYYRDSRTEQLSIVFEAMLMWTDCVLDVIVLSNVDSYEQTGFLQPWVERFAAKGHGLRLHVVGQLAEPKMLTWSHKAFLEPWIERAALESDFFMSIEDDIRITDENLHYFLDALPEVKARGFLPGFLRYEVTPSGEQRLVDLSQPEELDERNVRIAGVRYHGCHNPYWAGYILDRELAEEYLLSRSFSPTESVFTPWEIQERAAMGLTWENVPPRMISRIVIPLVDGLPDDACLVWHCANTYTAADHPVFGTLTVAETFAPLSLGARARRSLARMRARL